MLNCKISPGVSKTVSCKVELKDGALKGIRGTGQVTDLDRLFVVVKVSVTVRSVLVDKLLSVTAIVSWRDSASKVT